jgi:hypothetical protein
MSLRFEFRRLLQCRESPVDGGMIMYMAGNIKCWHEWYHVLAFILLPLTLLFPFVLVYFASSISTIRRPLTIVYRTRIIGRWGADEKMFLILLFFFVD